MPNARPQTPNKKMYLWIFSENKAINRTKSSWKNYLKIIEMSTKTKKGGTVWQYIKIRPLLEARPVGAKKLITKIR
jgi:hypothetical protein